MNDGQQTHTQHTNMQQRRRGIVGPLILITIGILFLLANMGYLSGAFWLTLVQFWPLLLILAGIEILFGRTLIGQLVVLSIALLALGGVVWFLLNPDQFAFGGGLTTTSISETSDEIESANVALNVGVGELDVRPLAADSPSWIEGNISYPTTWRLKKEYEVTDGVARLKLDTEGRSMTFGNASERWKLGLSPKIPITLSVDAGVGGATLDLNALNIARLDVNTGVGGMQVVMPSHAGTVTATLDGGIGGMTVLIPVGVPARIRSSTGIGGLTINTSRFPNVGKDLYQSPDYASATDRIDLAVDSGIGGISIP